MTMEAERAFDPDGNAGARIPATVLTGALLLLVLALAGLSLMAGRVWAPWSAWVSPQSDPRWAIIFELRLPRREPLHLAFDRILIEQLPACDPIDLRPHGGQPILVGELHFGLARHQGGEHVIAKHQIGGRAKVNRRHDRRQRGEGPHVPRLQRETAHLLAARQRQEIV